MATAKKTVKGVAEIELKHDQFTLPAKKVEQQFKDLAEIGKRSLGDLGQHAQNVQQKLKQFQQGGKEAFREVGNQATVMGAQLKSSTQSMAQTAAPAGAKAFNTIGRSSATAAAQVKMSAAEMNNAKLATVGLMGSVAGLAGSFVTLETSMSNIPKRLNAIAKAESLVETQEVSLQRQGTSLKRLQMQLDKARADGNKTLEEMEILERKVADTRANITLYTGKLSDAQEDLNLKHADYADTLKLMATSVFTTFLTAGATVTIMLSQAATQAKLTTGEYTRLKLATLANSRALKLLHFDLRTAKLRFVEMSATMHTSGTAAQVLQAKLKGVELGLKGIWAALGPVGWAIIGITTLYTMWTENTLGIRDATRSTIQEIQKLWEVLKWLNPIIGAVDEAWRRMDPEGYGKSTAAFSEAINLMGHDLRSVEVAANEMGLTLQDLEIMAKQTGSTVQQVADTYGIKYVSSADKAAGATAELGLSMEYTEKLAASLGVSIEEVQKMTGNLIPAVEGAADAFTAPGTGLVPAVNATVTAFAHKPDGLIPTLGQISAAMQGPDGYILAAQAAAEATIEIGGAVQDTGSRMSHGVAHVKQMTDAYIEMTMAAHRAGTEIKKVNLTAGGIQDQFMAKWRAAKAQEEALKKNDIQLSRDPSGRNIFGNELLRSLATRYTSFGSGSEGLRVLSARYGAQQLQQAADRSGGRRSVGNRVGGTFRGARRASSRSGRQGPGYRYGSWRYGSQPGYKGGGTGRPSATQRSRTMWHRNRNAPAVPHWQTYDLNAVGPGGNPLYIGGGPNAAEFFKRIDPALLQGMPADVAALLSLDDIIRSTRGRRRGRAGGGVDTRPHLYDTGVAVRKLFNERLAAEIKKTDALVDLISSYWDIDRTETRRTLRSGDTRALNNLAARARHHDANRAAWDNRLLQEANSA